MAFHAAIHFRIHLHIGGARVAVFFIVSGFVLWLITAGRQTHPWFFFGRRLARLVPLYWLVTIILVAKDFLGLSGHSPATVQQISGSLLFVPHLNNAGQLFPILVPGWTLVYEFFFCVIFAALLTLRETSRLWVASLLFGGLGLAGVVLRPTGAIAFTYTNPILLEFLAGIWVAHLSHGRSLGRLKALVLTASGVALSLVPTRLDSGPWAVAAAGVPALMIVVGVLALERKQGAPIRWLENIGDGAYSIYLWHLPVLGAVWALLALAGVTQAWLCVVIGTLAATLLGLVGYRWIEVPLTAFLFTRLDQMRRRRRPSRAEREAPAGEISMRD